MSNSASDIPAYRYTAQMAGQIEEKWQKYWLDQGTFNADNLVGSLAGPGAKKDPFFVMDMFPYPSGKGLHVGHPLGYISTDVTGRFQRMQGKNVLYTMGYDAFGLPAEQYAVTTGQHPRKTTNENIATMQRQLARIGLSHDQRRSFATIDQDYYRWTQWIFLQIFNSWYDPEATRPDGGKGAARPIQELIEKFASREKPLPEGAKWSDLTAKQREDVLKDYRLAYLSYAPVNWCPGLGTVLADEEVTSEGRSERGNFPVFRSHLRQWMMRITAYGDRLIQDLATLDWPEKVRTMQENWIGRSHGATVTFQVDTEKLQVYTTRPDTLFGATFMVVAPEHPILSGGGESELPTGALAIPAQWPEGTRDAWTGGYENPQQAVRAYQQQAAARSELERGGDSHEKTGVFTGLFATNPVNNRPIPVFTADYVMMGYGTGAIMAVPAHDQRDWDFAKKFDLDIIYTITPGPDAEKDTAWIGDGVIQNSANDQISLNGLGKAEAIKKITSWLETAGLGEATTTYRLRDWLFSRQRYWGEPFPVVYDEDGVVHALPESMLPLDLPEVDNFSPRTFAPDDADSSPEAPLGRAEDWIKVELDLGQGKKTYYRDTNVMPNWAGSCCYELRYLDPGEKDFLANPENERYWMGPREGASSGGTDLYVGGVEHAVLHLLYARFWHKVLYDLGYLSSLEPFHKLFNQGYIQAYAYTDKRGAYVPASEVQGDEASGFTYEGEPVNREYGKMGKSLKNIVTPDDICAEYGADTFRVYEMSMGPLDMSRPWETRAVVGSQRFLQRLWRNVVDENTGEVTVSEDAPDLETQRALAKAIAAVTEDYREMRLNLVVSDLIVLNNHLTALKAVPREAAEALVLMISPLAPHIAEELWNRLGHSSSLAREPFPVVTDESLLVEEEITAVVQINGKVKYRLQVPQSISAEELEKQALETEVVQRNLAGSAPLKVIVREPKLVNVVIRKSK
ncbi:leucine--tRNA ligase [Varibaculum cambriense]|uniref:Leucine--tRNA ligase n=1 Tax=Varibaculum cambriense TaxID=184870 RepID=A0ABX4URL1_9ACTO|nr:class I tRNA ligase family protein [Varibaculum cambriense]PMB88789.1 leucine--tRNA ligase [Varibaculum cambriense]